MKYNKTTLASLCMLVAIITPHTMFAAAQPSALPTKTNKFCTVIDAFVTKTEKQLASQGATNKGNNLEKRLATVSANRTENDKKVAEQRAEVLAKQEAHFATLSSRANTPEKKAAVAEFVEGVKKAIITRQTAIDTAKNTYRTGVDKVLSERKTAIETALATQKSTITAALSKAKTDCANNGDGAQIKATLQASIKSAHETLRTTLAALSKIQESTKALMDTRNTAIKKAQDEFKTTLDALKATLQAKLK